jgi:hypothetical protein
MCNRVFRAKHGDTNRCETAPSRNFTQPINKTPKAVLLPILAKVKYQPRFPLVQIGRGLPPRFESQHVVYRIDPLRFVLSR